MQDYIAKRILSASLTLLIVSISIFGLVRLIPGDAVVAQFTGQGSISAQDLQKARKDLGLERPLLQQYTSWISHFMVGDFGDSLVTHASVSRSIRTALPISAEIALISLSISILIAIPCGIMSAVKRGSIPDYLARVGTLLGLSIPSFWLGTLLIVLPSVWLGYLPPLTYVPFTDSVVVNLSQFVPPGIAVGFVGAAGLTRMMRSSMLEVIGADYIRTARSKGLSERVIMSRHALKLALIPVITIFGTQLAHVVTGTVVVETVFNLPGTGQLLIRAVTQRDYPIIQAMVMLLAISVVTVNLVVDLSYAWLDPRIRYK